MIERKIPRDISKYKAKLMLGLTTRQVVLFVPGGVLGIIMYFLLKDYIGNLAMGVGLMTALPFILFASFKPQGLPLEKFIASAVVPMLFSPTNRRYQNENSYQQTVLTNHQVQTQNTRPQKVKSKDSQYKTI